jgi:tetratricopeptide (TPR) repeat protein
VLAELRLDNWEQNLARLRDYSLVEHDPEDDRYYLLAPVRGLALRYLADEVQKSVAARAAPIFASMAAALINDWAKVGVGPTARLLARDEANLREVIDLCREIESPAPRVATPSLSVAGDLIYLYLVVDRLAAAERLGKAILSDQFWLKDTAGLAKVEFAAGGAALRRGQLDDADRLYQQAEQLYRTIGASLGLANTLQSEGDLEKQRGNAGVAMKQYVAAKEIYESITDPLGLSNVMSEIAELNVETGRSAEAVESTLKALQIADQCANQYALGKCLELLKKLGIDPETLK